MLPTWSRPVGEGAKRVVVMTLALARFLREEKNMLLYNWVRAGCVAFFGFLASTHAIATTYATEEFECPIGGEKFKAQVVVSNITFGQRPDGRRYGPLPIYPIVECPGNGFLLFAEDFTQEELAILSDVIETPKYIAMRSTDTPHYRAWWLLSQIRSEPVPQLNLLIQATWESDKNWKRKIRYQAEFVNITLKLERSEQNSDDWFWLNLRAINAMRELGYYQEALNRLELVVADKNLPTDPEAAANGKFFGSELRSLIEEENPAPEPANLIPTEQAKFRCVRPLLFPLTDVESATCQSSNVQEAIAAFEYKPKGGKRLKGEVAIRAALAGETESTHNH